MRSQITASASPSPHSSSRAQHRFWIRKGVSSTVGKCDTALPKETFSVTDSSVTVAIARVGNKDNLRQKKRFRSQRALYAENYLLGGRRVSSRHTMCRHTLTILTPFERMVPGQSAQNVVSGDLHCLELSEEISDDCRGSGRRSGCWSNSKRIDCSEMLNVRPVRDSEAL